MIPLILLLGLLLVIVQMFLPEIHPLQVRPYLLPLLVAYAALRYDLIKALVVAAGLGIFLDLYSFTRMGVSSIGFMLMVFFIFSQVDNLKFEYFLHAWILTLLGIFLYLTIDYLFFCLQAGTWRWPERVWIHIADQALLDTIVGIPVFPVLDGLKRWCVAKKVEPKRPSLR